VQEQ